MPSWLPVPEVSDLVAAHLMEEPENPWLKVLRKMGDGVLLLNREGQLIGANRIMRHHFGEELSVLIQAWAERTPPFGPSDTWKQLREAASSTLATSHSHQLELSFPLSHGTGYGHFNVYTVALEATLGSRQTSATGQKTGVCVAVFRDISTIRRTEKMRRDFVANVSHELRTPLSVLKGYAETLLNGGLDHPELAYEFVSVMEQHANRLSRLVDDLLDLSRMESEDYELELKPVNLLTIVNQVLALVRDNALAKGIHVTLDTAADNPANAWVMGHAASLEQVVYNLVENAIKYSPEDRKVVLTLQRQLTFTRPKPQDVLQDGSQDSKPGGVVLGVHDEGIGIAAKHIPRLFERFYRVDKARSREMGGTGLGLSIVKHIVQSHGGHIWVDSQLGQGSHFYVRLKATADPTTVGNNR